MNPKNCRFALATALAGFTALVSAQAPDRSKPPAPGPPPALNLPTIQKKQLSNGLPVWIVELHEVPVAQVNLVVFSGSADDPAGKFGVASLTAAMLEEGAGSRSALEIADAVDFLGADLGTSSAIDSSAVRLHVPVARLAEALPIMADVAIRPTFPKDELERLRQQRLTSLLQARDDPGRLPRLDSPGSCTARHIATGRRPSARPTPSKRSRPRICGPFTRRRSVQPTRRCSSSATWCRTR